MQTTTIVVNLATDRRIKGWAISLAVHTIMVGLALMLMAEIKYVPEKEAFRWDVALVEPQASEPSPALKSQPPAPTPAISRPASPPAPANTRAPQRIESRQVVEMAAAPPPTPVMARPMERPAIERKPLEQPQPVTQTEVLRKAESVESRPVETAQAQERQPVVEERREVEEPAAAVVAQAQDAPSVQAREPVTSVSAQDRSPISEDIVTNEQPVTKSVAPVETAAIQSTEAVTPTPAVSSPPSMLREESLAGTESSSPPIAHNQTPLLETTAAQERADDRVLDRAPITTAAARPTYQTRADFGWLTQSLWRRIEQLKRYPTRARLNKWEGTVVVRAVIKDDGHFAELVMEKSSGHDDLDKDALELLERASPLKLKHQLGRSAVTIRIPISYKLE